MAIVNMTCKTCKKDFLYSSVHSKNRKFCSIKCVRYQGAVNKLKGARGKGFWQISTNEEKWHKIKQEYDRLVIKKEGCWGWKKVPTNAGYAFISTGKGKIFLAHRASWIINKGPISSDEWVLHKCDNPICSNPEHLFLGTPKDNSDDCKNKNRRNDARGLNHYNVKLSEDDVRSIRNLTEQKYSQSQLGFMFNVHASTIQNIVDGKTWKHLK